MACASKWVIICYFPPFSRTHKNPSIKFPNHILQQLYVAMFFSNECLFRLSAPLFHSLPSLLTRRQAAMAFLALRCSDFQTRHGGVSVGQVDELNHFSGQQLPLGEANTVSSLPWKTQRQVPWLAPSFEGPVVYFGRDVLENHHEMGGAFFFAATKPNQTLTCWESQRLK